jgi:putative ABC transport system permease protein
MSDQLPRGIVAVLAAVVPADHRETIAGDLQEEYLALRARQPRWRARLWLWWHVLRLGAAFRRYGGAMPPITRDVAGRISMWDVLRHDLRFSARLLWRQPGFTVVAGAALALGIGASTAIFSIVDAVLWRPLPYPNSGEMVSIAEQRTREGRLYGPVSPPDFYDWRREARSFTAMAAINEPGVNELALSSRNGGEPEYLRAMIVSPEFLAVVGTPPISGRDLRREDEIFGRHRVALLTHSVWQRRFGADAAIVGRTIDLDGEAYEVIGIITPDFWWPTRPDVLIPLARGADEHTLRASHFFRVVGRRRSEVSLRQARLEMDVIGQRLSAAHPVENTGHHPNLRPLRDALVGDVRQGLLVLLGAVGLVMLIACVNVATLLVARATGRQTEFAVRIAVGAARSRLVRQLLTESLLLGVAGATAGMVLAHGLLRALRVALPAQFSTLPGIEQVGIDLRVLLLAVLALLVTGALFGLIPAFAGSELRVASALNEEGRAGVGGPRGRRARTSLVVAEVALSVVLLVGAGLFVVSFKRVLDVSPGFDPANLVTAPVTLPASRYGNQAQVAAFYDALFARLRGAPGIEAAAAATALPFSGMDGRTSFRIEGSTEPSATPVRAHPRLVTADYLATMRIPLVRGRYFSARDAAGAPDVVIINEATARRFWPEGDPIGKRMAFNLGPEARWLEIVGVVGDIKHQGLEADANPEAYLPFLQPTFSSYARRMSVVVRTTGDVPAIASLLRSAVAQTDPQQPVGAVARMEDTIAASIGSRRLTLLLLSAFAVMALLLTAAGLYGLMAYVVAQRTREIGVRMALGASRGTVLGLVMRQAGAWTLVGMGLGLLGAAALARSVSTLLFGVSASDPAIYAAVCLVLALVALAAVSVPSWRATRIEPLAALRER